MNVHEILCKGQSWGMKQLIHLSYQLTRRTVCEVAVVSHNASVEPNIIIQVKHYYITYSV